MAKELFIGYSICMCVDFYILYYYMIRILGWKKEWRYPWFLWAVMSMAAGVTAICLNNIPFLFEYITFWSFGLGMLFAAPLLKGNIFHKMQLVVYFFLFSQVTRFMADNTITLAAEKNAFIDKYYMQLTLISLLFIKVLLVFIVYYLIKTGVRSKIQLPVVYWIIMLVFSIVCMYCVVYINDLETQNDILSITCVITEFFMLLLALFMYYLFSQLNYEFEMNLNSQLKKQQMDMTEKFFVEMEEVYDDLKRLRHEMKNNVLYMDTMLQNEEYDKLHDFFKKFYYIGNEADQLILTENYMVNAVLNQKYKISQSANIKTEMAVFIPETIKIPMTEICTIISNLFDNAIEACREIKKAEIYLEVKMVKQYLAIYMTNTTKKDVLKENPQLNTHKEDAQYHGIGLWIIRDIVEKYDGIIQFSGGEKVFEVKIMLKDIQVQKEK